MASLGSAEAKEPSAGQPAPNAIGADAALSHSNCGAVDAAIKVIEENASLPGHLPGLVQSIKPAVEAAKLKAPEDLLLAAITENVALNVKRLQTAQPLLVSFAQNNAVKIVGGVYDLATGKIGLLS